VFSTTIRARSFTSGALCRASHSRGRSPSSAGSQTRLRHRLVKAGRFLESERLPSTNAPSREPATDPAAWPPRPGFRRAFAPRTTNGLPSVISRLDPRIAAKAVRRSSTSAIKTIREHARQTVRSPARTREVALPCAVRVGSSPYRSRARRPVTVRQNPSRGFADQRPRWLSPSRHLSSRLPAAIAARASPQPARLGHLVSLLRGEAGWMGRSSSSAREARWLRSNPASRLSPSPPRPTKTRSHGSWAAPLARASVAFGRGPPPVLPREEERDPLHPRYLSSLANPSRGGELSTGCHQSVDNPGGLFNSLEYPSP